MERGCLLPLALLLATAAAHLVPSLAPAHLTELVRVPGILKGTGLFDDLGLRSTAVRRGIAASRAAPLRSMKGAPPEVQGSGEIVSGKHRVGPKNEVDEDK